MKENRPFLNILVPLWTNRARTILYFIRYQEGLTSNERGSYWNRATLPPYIYLSLVRSPPTSPPLLTPSFLISSLAFLCLSLLSHSVPPMLTNHPSPILSSVRAQTRESEGGKGMQKLDLALSQRNDRGWSL